MQLELLPTSPSPESRLLAIAGVVKSAGPEPSLEGYQVAMAAIERILADESAPEATAAPESDLYNSAVGFRLSRTADEIARDMRAAVDDMADAFTMTFPGEDCTISLRKQDFGEIIVVAHSRRLGSEIVQSALKAASRCRPFLDEVA
jgi:hypothetical protein